MAMGRRRDRARTPGLWIATNELPRTGGHPFYQRLNGMLDEHAFDEFVEAQCAPFYAKKLGRPSLTPGMYFRLLLIGYFEGIDSERGIAWRTADSLALRGFLGLGLDEIPPEHSTISRTRRLIDLETHRAVFTWILQLLATVDLVKGKTIGIDATTLEANAALRSIVRRDTGESYQDFLTTLAQASGIETPTRADLARIDRKRKKKGNNKDWTHPHDPDARVTKMKDGRTLLAHKAEHAVDLETGAIVRITVQGADQGDTTTIETTLPEAVEQLEAVAAVTDDAVSTGEEVVTDKAYPASRSSGSCRPSGYGRTSASRTVGRRDGWISAPNVTPSMPIAPHTRRPRHTSAATPRRAPGTAERVALRDRRQAPHASPRARQHLEAAVAPCRRMQSRVAVRTLCGVGTPRSLQGRVAAAIATVVASGRSSHTSGRPVVRDRALQRDRSRPVIVLQCDHG
jgi:transposase